MGQKQFLVHLMHTTLIERGKPSMQESMMCSHLIDAVSVLSKLPSHRSHPFKAEIDFDGDPRVTMRALEDLMLS